MKLRLDVKTTGDVSEVTVIAEGTEAGHPMEVGVLTFPSEEAWDGFRDRLMRGSYSQVGLDIKERVIE